MIRNDDDDSDDGDYDGDECGDFRDDGDAENDKYSSGGGGNAATTDNDVDDDGDEVGRRARHREVHDVYENKNNDFVGYGVILVVVATNVVRIGGVDSDGGGFSR